MTATKNTAANTTANNAPHGWLLRYSDSAYLRPATFFELVDSVCAGDAGVIEVTIDGERVACYVEE